MAKCKICDGEDKCNFIGGIVSREPLNEDDWRELHEKMMGKWLPFTHKIIERARKRKAAKKKPQPRAG